MKIIIFSLAFLLFAIVVHVCLASKLRYDPTWESLDQRPIPTWYQEAKFGIFIHWGVYSVPSFAKVGDYAEWYWHELTEKPLSDTRAFHNRVYGEHFKYADFAPRFTAELFNADSWADIIKASGAQYVVLTSKHHDGFTLWNSRESWNWNSVDAGPHRDIIAELFKSLRAKSIHPGVYYSLYEWYHPLYLSDPARYVDEVMLRQLTDLATNYKCEMLWTDGEWDHDSAFWKAPTFLAWLFNSSPVKDQIVINDRWGKDTRNKHGTIFTPEYSSEVYLDHPWEENSGMDLHSYGFNRQTPASQYYTAEQLVKLLIRCVANNGNFLLDIGPNFDGTIPSIMQQRLLEIGDWMKVNGEAIHKTRTWRVQQEGGIDNTTLRYTHSAVDSSIVYAITLDWPSSNVLDIPSPVVNAQSAVTFLGYDAPLVFQSLGPRGLRVQLPAISLAKMPSRYAWVLKITAAK
eukprot:TRINITY_DN8811_c0_g1_i1.p1 TRINITY_DN8811_c0_g1~~TRINITY_DN8811_c0_g1_i1.p1  ORF type:complete len:459 (-),score=81.63 TRINITY_DN8811_c0_g1_i1:352-1728(-)